MPRRTNIIAERLGSDRAMELSRKVGGRRLWVPDRLCNAGRLEALVGHELAVLMVMHFGGGRPYVPVAAPGQRVDRRKVRRLMRQGLSSAKIAARLGCSERSIEWVRAKIAATASNSAANGQMLVLGLVAGPNAENASHRVYGASGDPHFPLAPAVAEA